MQTGNEKEANKDGQRRSASQMVVFAQTPNPGVTIGVVSDAEPSSLALLAAGVAGLAARRARRERTKAK
jgi:hypothetical protein